jgi:hypothetical protein
MSGYLETEQGIREDERRKVLRKIEKWCADQANDEAMHLSNVDLEPEDERAMLARIGAFRSAQEFVATQPVQQPTS